MKTIIAGSRTLTDYALVEQTVLDSGFLITEVVSGGSKGADTLAEVWAVVNHIPFVEFSADWESYGRAAGPIRNKEMADYAEALILIWDGKSKGSQSMLKEAEKKKLKIYEKVTQ